MLLYLKKKICNRHPPVGALAYKREEVRAGRFASDGHYKTWPPELASESVDYEAKTIIKFENTPTHQISAL